MPNDERQLTKMSCDLIIFLISILSLSVGEEGSDLSITYRKFVYQKDMSEYCRRRVMPSVFLGRQVVEANSQILHFSRLEVPYSCYVNVRTEMGSNIIVVIQVLSDIDMQKTCKQGDNQLLIYELGETFGGYWGQMPDSVMKRGPRRDDRSYTLEPKYTDPVTTATESTSTTTSTTTEATTTKDQTDMTTETEDDREYITLELPILNVSAQIVPGKLAEGSSFTTEDNFELIYDVTPWSGASYDTQMMPLLEVAVDKNKGRLRGGDKEQEVELSPDLQVQFNDLFTPDPRVTFAEYDATSPRTKSYKYHPNVNRRLNFKKNKQLFATKEALLNKKRISKYQRPQLNTVQANNYLSKLYDILQPPLRESGYDSEHKSHSWDILHAILKNLTNINQVSTQPPHKELADILRGISNTKFNESVYLSSDLSQIDLSTTRAAVTDDRSETMPMRKQSPSYRITHIDERNDRSEPSNVSDDSNKLSNKPNDSAINNDEAVVLLPLAQDVDSIILNVTNQKKDGVQEKPTMPWLVLEANTLIGAQKLDTVTVPLVDHESWENVVNAAPVMADKLNQSKVTDVPHDEEKVNVTKSRLSKLRKKRYIHAIDIEIANPHRLQVMKHLTTTPPPEKFDIREFQRLIELQDDEIHERVAMRYLRQYVGLPLLNFCDFNDTSSRHVYLFNSSRLVLALSNFTLKRMTVVVTPARTLLNSEARCASAHLECQVSGARVCIDSHSACDGVPNCGSYDIYDEDRLRCGAAAGLRHNVCLAAVTFLAVLLTILYTIHYWLKRCVPRVSDAFFIYTDAAENVLYLEPIMRSPNDMGVSKDFFHGAMQQYLEYEDTSVKENACRRFINRCLIFLRLRRRTPSEDEVVETELDNLYPQRISTFAEMEINKIAPFGIPFLSHVADVAVQTDSSLEMGALNLTPRGSKNEIYEQNNVSSTSMEPAGFIAVDSESSQPTEELNILKFFRKARAKSASLHINQDDDLFTVLDEMPVTKPVKEEKEIQCHEYNPDHYSIDQNIMPESSNKIVTDKVKKTVSPVRKHLRFQEEATIIPHPSQNEDADEEIVESTRNNNRRSIVFGASKVFRIQEEEPTETEEPSAGTGREFKSYFNWGSGKEKKKKKPKKK